MKIILEGHSYKYAAEQILLQTLPDEKPEFTDAIPESGSYAHIALREITIKGEALASVFAKLSHNGRVYFGRSQTRRIDPDSPLFDVINDRERSRAVKLAFFRAARRCTGVELPWGATTGIRPSTLITRMVLRSGMTEKAATATLRREYYVSAARAELALDAARAELKARRALAPNDLALYIGIPFCPTRCAYCSFVSQSVERSMELLPPFLDALKREADALAEAMAPASAHIGAVYIGGGTPTTPDAASIDALLTHLDKTFNFAASTEYTVEAGRADTITAEKLAVLKAHGVTRISVNPQTMSPEVLRAIGRRHTPEDVYAAFELVRAAGFDYVNADLIAGLPGDTQDGFRASLEALIALAPENITVHTLSRKRGARVTVENTPVPPGTEVSEMLSLASPALRAANYSPYYLYRQKFTSGGFENTGWTTPGGDCLYNIIMMDELRPVLALGAGVTKLVARPTESGDYGRIERLFNPKYPYEYIERIDGIIEKKRRVKEFLSREF
ncbi:MAG: coproporphyrinogen dehydrogenase HemZ [Oscillospiraceae bacterium]|jgi:oxygen-independent coproporphyrinogen-3 oxidase|nr:coproporphyrinogen dehydrogenase HemZ [Oscillospiraceae bacterium]